VIGDPYNQEGVLMSIRMSGPGFEALQLYCSHLFDAGYRAGMEAALNHKERA
jgi:hypothetical protein